MSNCKGIQEYMKLHSKDRMIIEAIVESDLKHGKI